MKNVAFKKDDKGMKKADVSRLLFFLSWILGVVVTGLSIFLESTVTPTGQVIPAVSDATFNFLIFFISTFTVNYLGRRATDAWHSKSLGLTNLAPPAATPVAPITDPTQGQLPVINVNEAKPVVIQPTGQGLSNVGSYHNTHP